MKEQYENLVMSSFMLYIDHKVSVRGEAYTNASGHFYPIENLYNGYYTYSCPYKQLVCDSGIAGNVSINAPDLMSGIFIDNVFTPTGTNGFVGINHHEGQVYFTTNMSANTLSGNFSVKDFNVKITSEPEETLIFETKFDLRPRTTSTPTGLSSSTETYPAIYLKNNGGRNDPYSFGGEDMTTVDARAIILSDSAFSLDAVCSIMKDLKNTHVPILKKEEIPFNGLGMATGNWTVNSLGDNRPGIGYNYTEISDGKITDGVSTYVEDVSISKIIANRGEFTNLNTNVYVAFADFSLQKPRFPRGSNIL
jgi:hypothetical protein